MARLWAWLLDRLQGMCEHPPKSVAADILEGGVPGASVMWCRICGAYRLEGQDAFREPRPTWEIERG